MTVSIRLVIKLVCIIAILYEPFRAVLMVFYVIGAELIKRAKHHRLRRRILKRIATLESGKSQEETHTSRRYPMKLKRILTLLLLPLYLVSIFTFPAGATADSPLPEPQSSISSDDRIHYININLDYGSSDCILIESGGETMLVDTTNPDLSTGGAQAIANDTANVNEAIRYLEARGIETLDYVVLTHNHSDHIGGVSRLCETGLISESTTVYYRCNEKTLEDDIYPDWENYLYLQRGLSAMEEVNAHVICLADENITQLNLQLGAFSIDFLNLDNDGDGVVDFDYENENNNSIVLRIAKGSVVTLLAGDIEAQVEAALAGQIGDIDVLKVPHHGNRTSSSYEFLRELQPETAILTANGYWQYGAYEYLSGIGTGIYTTGLCPGLAIVEVVGEDCYELLDAVPYTLTSDEGWHSWLDHSYYVSGGQVVRSSWEQLSGYWYYFDADGIMVTGAQTIDGTDYFFGYDGALVDNPPSSGMPRRHKW